MMQLVLDKHAVKVMIGVSFHSDFPNDNFFPLFTAVQVFLIYLEGAAGYFSVSRTIHSIAALRFSSVD
jgi:hypothetical protein